MSSEDRPEALVSFRGVSKAFVGSRRRSRLRSALPFEDPGPLLPPALVDIDLEVRAGESLGIIGRNGAGKSTLLKLAAGIYAPTAGTIELAGVPSSMIELGLSFNPDLTGWENLPVAAALFGVSGAELDAITDEVVEFSGIREFMDLQVKHFSSGMVARLGFALATHVPAPILLVDEVLAVGDRTFQQRCIQRVRHLVSTGTAALFVSHSLDLVVQVCDRAIRLEEGRVVDDGPATEVVARYASDVVLAPVCSADGAARLVDVRLASDRVLSGDDLEVEVEVEVEDAARPYLLQSALLQPAQGVSSVHHDDRLPIGAFERPGRWVLRGSVGPVVTTAGVLEIVIALVDGRDEDVVFGRCERRFEVIGEDVGVLRLVGEATWSVVEDRTDLADRVLPTPDPADPVQVRSVSKVFEPHRLVGGRASDAPSTVALDAVTFSLGGGGVVGLIGSNGAGKSTLLRVMLGITDPTTGSVELPDRVAAVIEVEAGFHGDLSGGENLEFSWRLHGGRSEDWARAFPAIERFADIGHVLNEPVKHYSTGMRARLALALALELGPDVLLIDEALSVGDARFRDAVRRRLQELVAGGTTVLFASHDLHLLGSICSRVLRLDEGRLIDDGDTAAVVAAAGGAGWAGGTTAADGGVVLGELRVAPAALGWNEAFAVEVDVEVLRASPHAYLELSIREALRPEERGVPRSRDQVLSSTLCIIRSSGIEGLLQAVGRSTVRIEIAGLPILNHHDVVVSVIDEIEGEVSSEQWQTVSFGTGGSGKVRTVVHWTVGSLLHP